MKRIGFLSFSIMALFLFAACMSIPGSIYGDGKVTETDRNVQNFTKIKISGSGNLEVIYGPYWQVKVRTDSNLQEQYITEVIGDTLHLHYQFGTSIWRQRELKIIVTMPEITEINTSGSAKITLYPGFNGRSFRLTSSGSSQFIAELDYSVCDFSLSGSGKVKVRGRSSDTQISSSGSAIIIADEFIVDRAGISVSGSGDIRISVREELTAKISGSGNIAYLGSPAIVNTHTSGSGKIYSE